MINDNKKVLVLDDQDGPQMLYGDEIRAVLNHPDSRLIKCRSLEAVEAQISRGTRGDIKIIAVVGDIEIYDREGDSSAVREAGLSAARLLIEHMLRVSPELYRPSGTVDGTTRLAHRSGPVQTEMFNYIVCSRYLELDDVTKGLRKLENDLKVWIPNKIERPVGLDEFRRVIRNTFGRCGVALHGLKK
ncbi:MAG: hypothetical protein NTY01_08150 [Verrucomicrobia bacterium]|nr:hypothetical protein [Verrucomicrobiota bacterium]